MPLTHTAHYRVRHYECDAHGFIRDDNILRYLQEVAIEASAAAGYDEARYRAMGTFWLVRETRIDIQQPLRYNDPIEVTTWVLDFRRVRSRRAYELRLAESGALVAQAFTDWAFLDLASGHPAPIPQHLIDAFFPEGPPRQALARERFPAAEPPPEPFSMRRRVEWRDLDPAGHVNNAVYLAYAEAAARRALASRGWPTARLVDAGVTPSARHHRISYRQPALPDDELVVAVWFTDEGLDALTRHATVVRSRDGALLAQANTLWRCLDLQTRRPLPWPQELLRDLS